MQPGPALCAPAEDEGSRAAAAQHLARALAVRLALDAPPDAPACALCTGIASVHCTGCRQPGGCRPHKPCRAVGLYLCAGCDVQQHRFFELGHERRTFQGGFFAPLQPSHMVNQASGQLDGKNSIPGCPCNQRHDQPSGASCIRIRACVCMFLPPWLQLCAPRAVTTCK